MIESALHPSIKEAADLLLPLFPDYVAGQSMLTDPDRIKLILQQLPADLSRVRESLEEQWSGSGDDHKRWNTLQRFLTEQGRSNVAKEIVLKMLYPRLDVHVTTGVNHLLKSPFCAHPKTGFICVPFEPSRLDEFDPMSVPKLSELVAQLNASKLSSENGEEKHLLAYKHTALKPAIEVFERFVNRVAAPRSSHQTAAAPELDAVRLPTPRSVVA